MPLNEVDGNADSDLDCQIVVVFDTDENGQVIVVMSSYREIG
jgi:hypothetical protein